MNFLIVLIKHVSSCDPTVAVCGETQQEWEKIQDKPKLAILAEMDCKKYPGMFALQIYIDKNQFLLMLL